MTRLEGIVEAKQSPARSPEDRALASALAGV
jgi:hypothetical protein